MVDPRRSDPAVAAAGPFRCLVLDFDGVVLESVAIKTEAFRELFEDHPEHLPRILDYHLAHNGVSRYVKFEHIYRQMLRLPYDEGIRHELDRRFSAIVFRRLLTCPFVRGAPAFLERFATRLPTYVASASPHEELNRIIDERGLRRYFVAAYGFPRSKEDVIEEALTRHDARPGELLYVGDSPRDFEAAKRHGVFFVGRRNEEDLDGLDAPLFDDLYEIGRWLDAAMRDRRPREDGEGAPC